MKKFRINSMNIRALSFILGALFIGFIWFYTAYLLPVGSVNGETILKYEAVQRINLDNAIKNIGKDKAFDAAMRELGVSVTTAEVEKEFNVMAESYGGTHELRNILIDMQSNPESLKNSIRKGRLKQKAIEKFSESIVYTDEDLQAFYEEYQENYANGYEEKKEQIISDYLMTKGAEEYERYIESYEQSVKIKIY